MVLEPLPMYFYYLVFALYLLISIPAIVECLNSNNRNKIGWIALIILLPFLGPILYLNFAAGRSLSEL